MPTSITPAAGPATFTNIVVPSGGVTVSVPLENIGRLMAIWKNTGSNALTNVTVALAAAPTVNSVTGSGNSVVRLNGTNGDFGTATARLLDASSNPHLTAAGAASFIEVDCGGNTQRIDITFYSSSGTTITIDLSGAVPVIAGE